MVCQLDQTDELNDTQKPTCLNDARLNKKSSSLNNLYSRPSDSMHLSRIDLLKRDQKISQSEFDIYQQSKFDDNISDIVVDFVGDNDEDDDDVYDDNNGDSISQKCENLTVINKQDIDDDNFISSSPSLSIGDYKSFISDDIVSSTSSILSNNPTLTKQLNKPNATTYQNTVKITAQSILFNDVTSLCSYQSNYSQFDNYFNTTTTTATSKIQPKPAIQSQCNNNETNKKFSFSFFNRFSTQNTSNVTSLFSKFFNNSNDIKQQANQTGAIDVAPNTVLILENRPSNLPAKPIEEAQKHKHEYEKMVEQARKKEQKDQESKVKKHEQQLKKEDFMANSLKIWNTEIIPNWHDLKLSKRTQLLWWHGLPPSIRGKVWKLAIGNQLGLTNDCYILFKNKAEERIETLNKNSTEISQTSKFDQETSVELIKLDVSRTFPQLKLFQKDGPYYDALHSVLSAYACYNTRIGYVQGMSFLAAILLLNMEENDAFVCLSNLLNTNYLIACFRMDQYKMNCYFKIHQILFEHNLPKLYRHFERNKVKPDLYLIEWIFTLFSKSLPLDIVSRIWDVYLRDKDEFLFRTTLGILNLYKDILINMDFIHCVQYLTKLPDDINSTQLFKSIEQMHTTIDNQYLKFTDLVESIVK